MAASRAGGLGVQSYPSTRSPGFIRTHISAGLPRGMSRSTAFDSSPSCVRSPVSRGRLEWMSPSGDFCTRRLPCDTLLPGGGESWSVCWRAWRRARVVWPVRQESSNAEGCLYVGNRCTGHHLVALSTLRMVCRCWSRRRVVAHFHGLDCGRARHRRHCVWRKEHHCRRAAEPVGDGRRRALWLFHRRHGLASAGRALLLRHLCRCALAA